MSGVELNKQSEGAQGHIGLDPVAEILGSHRPVAGMGLGKGRKRRRNSRIDKLDIVSPVKPG